MGYKLTKQSNNTVYDVYELIVDTSEDLKKLPSYIGAGSTAIVTEGTGGSLEVYLKTNSGEWIVI